jgi:hypothetical protein
MSITKLCNCCDDCFSDMINECPDGFEFLIPDLPDQTVAMYILNIATNRVIMVSAESINGNVYFDVSDIDFANSQTYKAHLRDEAGAVITFDMNNEEFNCYQFRYEPIYVN